MKHGQIAEYRDTSGKMSQVTILDSAVNKRREYFLKHHKPGFECAGSVARWNGREVWSVSFEANGATHGQRFLTRHEAETLFNKWSGRDAEIEQQIIRDEIRAETYALPSTIRQALL